MQRVRKIVKNVLLQLCRPDVSLSRPKLHVGKFAHLCVLVSVMLALRKESWTDRSAPGYAVARLLVKENMSDLGQSIAWSLFDYHGRRSLQLRHSTERVVCQPLLIPNNNVTEER